jgi:hypothetical protein
MQFFTEGLLAVTLHFWTHIYPLYRHPYLSCKVYRWIFYSGYRGPTSLYFLSIGYYRKFNKVYAGIIAPIEKLMKKSTEYLWMEECQHAFDALKEHLVTAPILIFTDWNRVFHVHVDTLSITLGIVLAQSREGEIDYPIAFASPILFDVEKIPQQQKGKDLQLYTRYRNLGTISWDQNSNSLQTTPHSNT